MICPICKFLNCVTTIMTPDCGSGRVIFKLGTIVKTPDVVLKTPQYRCWPLTGDVLVATTITIDQQVPVTTKIVDRKGNPAKVDGVPEWSTDNTDVVALTPTADGLGCMIASTGMVGTANVQMSADADLGQGTKPILGTIAIEVTPGEAITVELTLGTPEPIPTP